MAYFSELAIRDFAYIPTSDNSSSEGEVSQSIGSHDSSRYSQEQTIPACNKDLKSFHFSEPRRTSGPISYTRKRKFHGNRYKKRTATSRSSTDTPKSGP